MKTLSVTTHAGEKIALEAATIEALASRLRGPLLCPDQDGYEAARRLKSGPETKAIPIIALTGNAMDEQRREAMEAGCDDFIAKPVDFDSLLERISAVLKVDGTV